MATLTQAFVDPWPSEVGKIDSWFGPHSFACDVRAGCGKVLCRSKLVKKFEGDGWKALLEGAPRTLCRTFVHEVGRALSVAAERVEILDMRIGSLYVTFHVTHDEDITQEELDRRIEEYPFREMWRLYNQGDVAADGLDAALQRIADMDATLKAKDAELSQMRGENADKIADLERQIAAVQSTAAARAAQRESELIDALAKEQAEHKKDAAELRAMTEQNKKLLERLKHEKQRFDKTAQRQSDLIAAIIQENKKEKEAKEREHKEQLELKEFIIENLKEELRSRPEDGATPMRWTDVGNSEELDSLMSRLEEMTLVLQQTQESEAEARGEIQRLTEALKLSEDARQADSVTYENDLLALQVQLAAFRDTKLAEDHEKRAVESRSVRGGNANKDYKENETIVHQYETTLENILGTLQDRLLILRDEYESYIKVALKEVDSELSILEEHEEDSRTIRQAFRTTSIALQKIFWDTHEAEVPQLIHDLDGAAAEAEKSSAAVKVAMAMLSSKKNSFAEQREWMLSHQQTLQEMITSLRSLNKRAFARQLALMNNTVAVNGAS